MNRILAGGVHYLGVVVEGVKEIKKVFQAARNVQKQLKNNQFSTLTDLKKRQKACFYLKVLYKIYSPDVF
jgi:hypothetical protein